MGAQQKSQKRLFLLQRIIHQKCEETVQQEWVGTRAARAHFQKKHGNPGKSLQVKQLNHIFFSFLMFFFVQNSDQLEIIGCNMCWIAGILTTFLQYWEFWNCLHYHLVFLRIWIAAWKCACCVSYVIGGADGLRCEEEEERAKIQMWQQKYTNSNKTMWVTALFFYLGYNNCGESYTCC